jgi:hypothetical protein
MNERNKNLKKAREEYQRKLKAGEVQKANPKSPTEK